VIPPFSTLQMCQFTHICSLNVNVNFPFNIFVRTLHLETQVQRPPKYTTDTHYISSIYSMYTRHVIEQIIWHNCE